MRRRVASALCDPVVNYKNRLIGNFGWQFTLMMASAYFGVKGALYSFNGLAMLPYYKGKGVSGTDYQLYSSIARAPFSMKALFGAVSDAVPFFGYHKASYIVFSSILGSLAYVVLGSFWVSASTAALLFFAIGVELAVVDLLCEGKYAELMREKPETGAALVTWVWLTYHVGSFVAALLTGPIADSSYGIQTVFWICLPLAAQVSIPVALGYLKDVRRKQGDRGVRWGKLRQHPKIFMLSMGMAAGAFGQALVNLFFRPFPMVLLAYSVSASCVLIVAAFWAMPITLAKANLFLFLDAVVYIQIGGALEYWFTASHDCVPSGPAFDYTYYSTYTRVVGSIAAMAGVALFQHVMGEWRMRKIFVTTTILRSLAGLFDIIMVERVNIAIGISDKWMYMLGDAIIYEVAYMLNFMPVVVLISKLCPKDMESTTYAVLAGFSNFGQQVASTLGIVFITGYGIKSEVTTKCSATGATGCTLNVTAIDESGNVCPALDCFEIPCKWDNLSVIIFLTHILIPLAIVPLSFVLIPDAACTDDMSSGLFGDPVTTSGGLELTEVRGRDDQEVDEDAKEKAKEEDATQSFKDTEHLL
mmetsp:Transcript_28609/g.66872  ORF Transcript_28609/g.66872 Transcript_28609/m.66872 type:complete len:587 (-) Transcript_28609:74-1834(-)